MLFLLLGLVLLPLLSLPLNLPLRLEIPGPRLAAWVHTCCSFVCMIETHLQRQERKEIENENENENENEKRERE